MTNDAPPAQPRGPAFDAIAALITRGLSAPLDTHELAELDRLIAATPGGQAYADDLVDSWVLAGIAGDPRPMEARAEAETATPDIATHEPASQRGHGLLRRWRLGAVAAVAAMLLGTGLLMHFHAGQAPEQLIAATDAPLTATMEDGSRVSLSRDGKVFVRMDGKRRLLRQIGGEAYYEVAKDHARPFTVETSGYRVTALGTRFNVSPDPGGLRIDLLEGRLRIETEQPGKPPVFLAAGQRFVGGSHPKVEVADPAAADWRTGRLVFNDVPLGEVAGKLSRYSGRRIGIRSHAAADLRFSGVLRWDMPDDWTAAFEATLPVTVEQAPDGIEIADARP